MRFVACKVCRFVYQIGGDLGEIDRLLAGMSNVPCITPLCGGRLVRVAHDIPVGYQQREIPIRNFYRAIHGFGLGDGAPASLRRVRELLLTKKIVDINGESVGQPERVVIRQLILEDGTRLHFDISSRGACLYYIEEAGPSCVEVFDDTTSTERPDQNREEVGRAVEALRDLRDKARSIANSTPALEQPSAGGVPTLSKAG